MTAARGFSYLKKELNYNADKDDSLAFLRATYARIFSSDPELERGMLSKEPATTKSAQIDGATEHGSKLGFSGLTERTAQEGQS